MILKVFWRQYYTVYSSIKKSLGDWILNAFAIKKLKRLKRINIYIIFGYHTMYICNEKSHYVFLKYIALYVCESSLKEKKNSMRQLILLMPLQI